MKIVTGRSAILKLVIVAIVFLLGVFGLTGDRQKAAASAQGPSASHTNAPGEDNCTACHSDFDVNSGTGSVTIAGIPHDYLPGQQIPITVTTSQADQTIYGFQMTAIDSLGREAGTFTLPAQNPPRMQIMPGSVGGVDRKYVEHTVDGLSNGGFGSNSWSFTWTAPARRIGKIDFYAAGNSANSDGGPSGDYIYTKATASLSGSATSNFDGDFISDMAVFRPSNGGWYLLQSQVGFAGVQFGFSTDRLAPADFDGDGKTDIAIFRPSNGFWYVLNSGNSTVSYIGFGIAEDLPTPADYDGDGKADVSVFRPSTGSWYRTNSSNGSFSGVPFGANGDQPTIGDFDGDGKADIGIYRPSTGGWYHINSSNASVFGIGFGGATDVIVPADYDGDGKTDVAVYRPSNGFWYIVNSSTSAVTYTGFGQAADIPAPGDFDGDGKADISVFRPTDANWYRLNSSDGGFVATPFGANGDKPIQSAYQ